MSICGDMVYVLEASMETHRNGVQWFPMQVLQTLNACYAEEEAVKYLADEDRVFGDPWRLADGRLDMGKWRVRRYRIEPARRTLVNMKQERFDRLAGGRR